MVKYMFTKYGKVGYKTIIQNDPVKCFLYNTIYRIYLPNIGHHFLFERSDRWKSDASFESQRDYSRGISNASEEEILLYVNMTLNINYMFPLY